jgi:hypothetical protein
MTEGEVYIGRVLYGDILRLWFSLMEKIVGDLYVDCGANACSFLEVKMHVIFSLVKFMQMHVRFLEVKMHVISL